MLRDPTMFNIPDEEIGMKISNLVVYSIPFTIVTIMFTSYAFEILGRRWTLFMSFMLTSLIYFWMPRAAPNYNTLMILRCLIAITMAAPLSHPLVADYVHVNSRGKMIALCGMGIVMGEIMAISIFKLQTVLEQNFYASFDQLSIIIFVFSIYFLYVLKDPTLPQLQRHADQQHQPNQRMGLFTKIRRFNTMVWTELLSKPVLITTLIGSSITRLLSVLFSTYLILWIQSF